jgi:hypothetical protein
MLIAARLIRALCRYVLTGEEIWTNFVKERKSMGRFLLLTLVGGCLMAIAPGRSVIPKSNPVRLQKKTCCGYWIARTPSTVDEQYAISNVFRRLPCGDSEYDREVLKYVYGVVGPQKNKIHLDCQETREEANSIRKEILRRLGKPKTVWSIPDAPAKLR